MNVILLEDVKSLGKKGDVVKVNDGYARNYIIPKKLGIEATAKNMNDLKLKRASEEKKAKELLATAQEFAVRLETMSVSVKMRAGEGGKLFGSVSSKEIASAYKEQCGVEIDKKKIQLDEPLKAYGEYEITVRLHPQVTGKLQVKVEP